MILVSLPTATTDRLLLLFAAALFSTGGAAIKGCALTSWQIASFRSGIAALVLFGCMPSSRRIWNWRVWVVGIAYAATLILFVTANKLTTSANAIFLQATAPLYLLVISPLALGERVRWSDTLAMSAVACGAILLFLGADRARATASNPALGNIFGALSGLTWAITIAGLRWLGRKSGTASATVVAGNLLAFLACLPLALPLSNAQPRDLAVVGYLGVFQVGLAYVALTHSIPRVRALEASTLLLAEPVFNPLWTWWIHGERPSSYAVAGGAIILLATFAATWWHSRAASTR